MPSKLYRDEAIVLRTYRLGEADRIIVMLTRAHGQVRAVAKGVRKTGSRFGARLEPFSMVDVQLHAGHSLDVVTQVETIEPFSAPVCSDYAVFTCASTMVETAERLTEDDGDLGTTDSPQQFLLLYGALAAMARRRHARAWSWTPTCCAPWRWPAGRRRALTARAAVSRGRTPPSTSRPVARCAPAAGRPAAWRSAPARWRCWGRCCQGTGPWLTPGAP